MAPKSDKTVGGVRKTTGAKQGVKKSPVKKNVRKDGVRIRKILIANRGEIACRVIRSAKGMGIKTVAIYSEADRDALHVIEADEAVCVGPAPSAQSYLNIAAVIAAIKKTGADAVHPGYGFLSENAAFCRRLKREGVTFIGPDPRAIKAMGDKIESKRLAEKAGVSTVPGFDGALRDTDHAIEVAAAIGYPVMIKASAGGGGKGMRIARDEADVREGFPAAVREAKSGFGDDRVFIEKYIENPRHIEIQIMADRQGNIVHFGERECSIQRRHQKVVEEAPSPFITPETRRAMGAQAVALARAVDYVSAGTVEFIVDQRQNFYFLEMNTRLQVEHPVTELVYGVDLVDLMIRVAQGAPLGIVQKNIRPKGWAIETRIYAEDPFRGFLPSVGRLVRYRAPGEEGGVRVDSGVYEGGEISIHYDPMIAKLITYGETRALAIARMRLALDAFYIRGVRHNIAFLAALVGHPRFNEGRLSTDFIVEEYPDGFSSADVVHDDPVILDIVAVCMHRAYQARAAQISGQWANHERAVRDDWVILAPGRRTRATARIVEGGFEVAVGKKTHRVVTTWRLGEGMFEARINDAFYCVQVERLNVGYRLINSGSEADIRVLSERAAHLSGLMVDKPGRDVSNLLISPMPGLLVDLRVDVGQSVKAGDEIAVIEAMKMENVLRADKDGVVKTVHAQKGESLRVDQTIVEFV
ncbi:acetyl-CoA carboxylase biotin carboxylase subunit [Varunaivibrio sulfuroxidans]|uniref:Biotin carboxylase n=1 Tax=Varunaivibrio sulfuroxidans TaxID=1773489 RepID=A0A4R3J810_9PROT|nr:acetyl-CoA carboxylase biotin carboxylase subunit [Varunaivibrio sulfuroxidans]TCS62089.1 biotin carboxyl carrier protein /biotin carboxylase [Varunaivibrio sulfuroxidans]WES30522.1 acetyl-CoA carboxylase biotin carboxylase subunit [Varunaivibrio sulfuroxidans]